MSIRRPTSRSGWAFQEELITALRDSPIWDSSAYIITYDEHGGYFDHVSPPQVDAFGLGVRIPTWIVSPWAKKGYLDPTLYDSTSILKFIERLHGLPTLASVNHTVRRCHARPAATIRRPDRMSVRRRRRATIAATWATCSTRSRSRGDRGGDPRPAGRTPTPGRRDPTDPAFPLERSGRGFPRGRADHDRGECVVGLRPGLAKLERERLTETLAEGPQERLADLVVVILANAVAGRAVDRGLRGPG